MLERLRRIALPAVGAIGVLVKTIARRRPQMSPTALTALRHLATHTSASLPNLSSRLKLPREHTLKLLSDLEHRGFVQLSPGKGGETARIAAITKAGREQIA